MSLYFSDRPMQNGFIEGFNACYRRGASDIDVSTLSAKHTCASSTGGRTYKQEIPQGNGGLTPTAF